MKNIHIYIHDICKYIYMCINIYMHSEVFQEINNLIFKLDKFYRIIFDDFTLALQIPCENVFRHLKPNPKPLAKWI